ncbi:Uncharacterized protein TCM_041741 isoform 1 [Theobroma cacao]|uniref:Uncharacterized protein isoform 1 n=1 Tax=Theobroma cacao TaxID=3641 RepID=A0A061GWV1_THECC|nr:Uncharacterized protein TCM_041741 isoform 1 [Theobroma cacao]
MESKRQVGSSSSFTADLFGSKESSSSTSKGIFSSIFPPPSMVYTLSHAGGCSCYGYRGREELLKLQGVRILAKSVFRRFSLETWNASIGENKFQVYLLVNSSTFVSIGAYPQNFSVFTPLAEGATYNIPNKERNSVFQEERAEPCHLSSSLYYGGQDIYSRSSSTQTSTSYPIFKKDGGEDDPNGNNSQDASRGNWWQGTDVRFIIRACASSAYGFSISFPRNSYSKQIIMEDKKYE